MQIVWSNGSWWTAFEKVTLVELWACLCALHETLMREKWEWYVRGIIVFDMSIVSRLIPVHCGFASIGRSSQRCRLGFGSLTSSVSSFISAIFLRIIFYPSSAKSFLSVWLLSSGYVLFTSGHWAWSRVRWNGWIGVSAGSMDPQSSTWRICGPDLSLKDFPSNR